MKVLIVSPHHPPTNAADMHRVRMLVPHLAAHGWEAEVLAVEAAQVAAPVDAWFERGTPVSVPVHRVKALGLGWGRVPGLGTLTFRALRALRRKGNELLGRGASCDAASPRGSRLPASGTRSFDLVYFSTTQFGVHVLGPEWKMRYRVPFAMDYQDPWVNDYYRQHPEVVPPGGRLKYAVVDWLARRQEPRVLRVCSGVTAVSAAYPEDLRRRYGFLRSDWPTLVEPFPGNAEDFRQVVDSGGRQRVFDPNDGHLHWVYVGRGGEDMEKAVSALFLAVQRHRQQSPEEVQRLRMHFIGTSYGHGPDARPTIAPVAEAHGLGDLVVEHPARIPYSETLRCLLDAHALVVPGSDDPGYTASKIVPYLLARRPLLAIFHERSSVTALIRRVGGGVVEAFDESTAVDDLARGIRDRWLTGKAHSVTPKLDETALAPQLAPTSAARLSEFFHRAVAWHPEGALS